MGIMGKTIKLIKEKKDYNILFTIDDDAYMSDVFGISFGESERVQTNPYIITYQPILYNGKQIGWLKEWVGGAINSMVHTCFIYEFENKEEENKYLNHTHFVEDKDNYLQFAKLQQFIDFYKENKKLI